MKRLRQKTNPLTQFGIVPVGFGTLADILGDYKSPQNKIASLEKEGSLVRLKKGVYLVSGDIHGQIFSRELVANHLYGPSYVSLESALAHYGLIPERVHVVRSVTAKRGKKIATLLGDFEYITVPGDYYAIGIRQQIIGKQYAWLMASPEKAICDMIVTTRGLRLQSPKAVRVWLEEDMRIDPDALSAFDTEIIGQCAACGKKKIELTHLYKLLKK